MLPRQRMAFSHVIYSSGLFALTLAFALIAVVILALRFVAEPQTLKVAVGPAEGIDAKLIAAIAGHLHPQRDRMRFVIVATDGPAESAKSLESRQADLAVIRTDTAIPPNGATVAVLHNDVALLAAPPNSAVKKVTDLSRKRVGLFPATPANAALLDAILAEYKIAPATVQHVMLSADDLTNDVKKRIDALLAVAPLRDRSIGRAIAALGSEKHAPVVLAIDAAEGMAARDTAYRKVDIAAGFFRGSPPQPKEDVATLAVAVRLEARQTLPEQTVTDLTKRLFMMRRAVQDETSLVSVIEKPDTEKGSADTVHPGAAAYYDGNEKSFMDRYGDWLYIGAMAFSGLVSALAALIGVIRRRARKAALALIDQLTNLKQEAHTTTEVSRLKELEAKINDLSTMGVRFAREHDFDSDGLMALRLAIDEARLAIHDQYEKVETRPLLTHAPLAPPPLRDAGS